MGKTTAVAWRHEVVVGTSVEVGRKWCILIGGRYQRAELVVFLDL